MQINSVIFDMDGVMIDSEPQWAKAQIAVLAEFGIAITEKECEKFTRGKRIDELSETWIKKFNLSVSNQKLSEAILENGCNAIAQTGIALKGLYELLAFLKSNHIKLAVATSSPPVVIKTIFDRLKLWDYFPIQCSAMDEEYGKPHPAVYLRAVKKLGIEKQECIVIEDSITGLIAAKAANLTTFLVNSNYENEKFSIADERMASLLDVMTKLKLY
ncbi:hexitol phosphatase HxpB [Histophilus somni]|uniref:hexitol phosphatase HxpB n=1 Tax=Histophilus somni TaxID=731 RepID=UPI0000397691|nr:hexitol phosphatase HxpB [Histophilus somni]ACA30799.1 HAD-superfamily hydrolase, subfamily IA, variant 3 [Histophilus somni 2336]QEH17704.1 hexitol phosphatase HxpB [Histophilus somni]QQF86758.1 hexitol phosphatase HxpB [Histophilus somni]QQJ89445.1 hexitol phosphatase HxpB [Histophilus somni]THA22217.1 hexitol phosphatase HxpB [Histophilus somni]